MKKTIYRKMFSFVLVLTVMVSLAFSMSTRNEASISNAATGVSGGAGVVKYPADFKIQIDYSKVKPLSLAKTSASTMPGKADLSWSMPPVANQGLRNCSSFLLTYYFRTFQESKELGWGTNSKNHQFSPSFLFNQTKAWLPRTINGVASTDVNDPMNYAAAAVETNLAFLRDTGCCTFDKMDFPQKTTYTIDDINSTPSPDAVKQASRFKIRDSIQIAAF